MLLSDHERDRRWASTHDLIERHELDAVVVRGTPDANGHLRYLSLFVPLTDSVAFVLFRDGRNVLVVTDGVQAYFAEKTSWATEIRIGAVGVELALCLCDAGVARVGVAGPEGLPQPWLDELRASCSPEDVVDVGDQLTELRWVKSAEEIALVRQSCDAANQVFAQAREVVRSGRRAYEVLADLDHILRLRGCERSFNLIIPLPDAPFDRSPSPQVLGKGDVFILEASPQFGGYYSQLTTVVSMGLAENALRSAFDAGVEARSVVEPCLVPGADLADISREVAAELRQRGYEMRSPDIGHLCGLELAEPRVGGASLELRAGMVLIFHPVVTDPRYRFVMRGDTYLIHEGGAERLTSHPTELQECA